MLCAAIMRGGTWRNRCLKDHVLLLSLVATSRFLKYRYLLKPLLDHHLDLLPLFFLLKIECTALIIEHSLLVDHAVLDQEGEIEGESSDDH